MDGWIGGDAAWAGAGLGLEELVQYAEAQALAACLQCQRVIHHQLTYSLTHPPIQNPYAHTHSPEAKPIIISNPTVSKAKEAAAKFNLPEFTDDAMKVGRERLLDPSKVGDGLGCPLSKPGSRKSKSVRHTLTGFLHIPHTPIHTPQVINHPDVDAVWICSPSQYHADQIKVG